MAHLETEAAEIQTDEAPNQAETNQEYQSQHASRNLSLEEAAMELEGIFEPEEAPQQEASDEGEEEQPPQQEKAEDEVDETEQEADPEDTEDEESTQEEELQEEAIPLPVSWSKENEEYWRKAPLEVQRTFAERDAERDKFLHDTKAKYKAEHAEEMKLTQQEREAVNNMGLEYHHARQHMLEQQLGLPDQRLKDPNSPLFDMEQWNAQVAQYNQNKQAIEQEKKAYEYFEAQRRQQEDIANKQRILERNNKLKDLLPEWGKEDHVNKMVNYVGQFGFEKDVLLEADEGEIILAHKAMMFDELMAQKPQVKDQVKNAPKVQKPGVKTKNSNKNSLNNAQKKLKRSGSVDDAAAVLAHIMKD